MMLRMAVCGTLLAALVAFPVAAQTPPSSVSVRDFGAKGDGKTDDTAAFTRAMAAVSDKGGTVSVPVGDYLVRTHLTVPSKVTLEGVWKVPTAWTQHQGSTLLAVEGAGSETGPAFVTLNANSVLKGLTVFYPDQRPEKVVPYPWCVATAGGDNASIIDCLLVNPYQAVDFGTQPSGRHMIRNLYGQPLRRGIFVDKCFDVGRIENVHFWPFWIWDEKTGIRDWMWAHGEAFIFGRTDWEYVLNTFVFGYETGYHFIATTDGGMNGNLLGIGADASHVAVRVDASQPYGLLITNGEFVSFAGEKPTQVVVGPENSGRVNFANCAFWGNPTQVGDIAGTGTVSFSNCNFIDWDRDGKNAPAFTLSGGSLLVNGCDFAGTAPQAELVDKADSAAFVGNHMAGPLAIRNTADADLQAGLNVFGKRRARTAEEPGAVVVDDTMDADRVAFTGPWTPVVAPGNYEGRAHWTVKGTGEAKATFRAPVPKEGRYTVFAWLGPDPNHDHATNVPVTVQAGDGEHTVRLDESRAAGEWVKVGDFALPAGDVPVTITNDADGNVLADAVKAVPAR